MKASISIVRIWIHLGLIPSADVSLYIWALDYLFFNLLTWGTLLFLGFVFNCVPRCLLFLILYLPLRIYAGGFHAKTKIGCYLISAFTFLFVVLYPADTTIHFYHLVFPCISTCIIYYFSPVSATNKPLDDLEALHYKKMARKILFSEILFFLLILLIFNTQITFAIDAVRDFRPAGTLGCDCRGDCYTVVIRGEEKHLFFERVDPLFSGRVGRWFVEKTV